MGAGELHDGGETPPTDYHFIPSLVASYYGKGG